MDTKLKSRWLWGTGIVVIIAIGMIILLSWQQTGKIDYKLIVALIGSGVPVYSIIIGGVFSVNGVKKLVEFKDLVFDMFKNTDKKIKKLEDAVLIITKKDLEEAEKFERRFNFMENSLTDIGERLFNLDEKWEAKRTISNLGKKIKRVATDITNEYPNIKDETKEYLRKLSNMFSDFITDEYEYGLKDLDLAEFENLLTYCIDESYQYLDKTDVKPVVTTSEKCIQKYVKDLTGVQGFQNGERREKFEEKTQTFIKNISHQILKVSEPKPEKV